MALSPDGSDWIACRKNFFLPVRVLSRLYRRLILEGLARLHKAGKLNFFGDHAELIDRAAFDAFLHPLRKIDWIVYAKEPFAGPKAVLAYLSRYTHRVAISNSRLIRFDAHSVTFKVKNYRANGSDRHTNMTLNTAEVVRRFLIHVLPKGQHRICHYGFFGNGNRAANIARISQLLGVRSPNRDDADGVTGGDADQTPKILVLHCSCCGGRLIIVDTFAPDITKDTFSRCRCHLRNHYHALIKSSTQQKALAQEIHHAYRPNARKVEAEISLTGPVRRNCQISPMPSPTYKSP